MKEKKKKYFIISILLIVTSVAVLLLRKSYAILLDNDVEVQINSELIYYLDVSYDGVDRNGVESNNTTTSYVRSGNIHVVDKIPDGLTFTGFVTTSDGSIGAVERETNVACAGRVVDDTNDDGVWNRTNTEYTYHGLHYDANTREVSFNVKNLRAGCVLTVGIKTQTPSSIDNLSTPVIEKRRDFYNFASAKENNLIINSNTVHAYMGNDTELYKVQYAYTGEVPSNAPSVPMMQEYSVNTSVGVSSNVNIPGYTFSGWTTSDVTVSNNSFIMPSNDVTLTGSFTPVSPNKVKYILRGTKPNKYVLPSEKEYYSDTTVSVDGLSNGDVVDGYKFSGWTTSSVTVDDENEFVMPDQDVVFYGEFNDVTYQVTYAFYDTVLPPNSDSLLPLSRSYRPGTVVTLANVENVQGYEFLGWYKENNFEMPEEDIIIYGEWKEVSGYFEPSITKTIHNSKDYYEPGDIITYNITVKNNDNFNLHDIFIKESNDNIVFTENNGYSVITKSYVKIDELQANTEITLYATYKVKETDKNKIDNEAKIVGALASNGYQLKDKEYKDSASANIKSSIKICKKISGTDVGNTFQIKIYNNNYETWAILKKDECKKIYINPGIYKIKEIVPQEYEISEIEGLASNDGSLNILQGNDYEISFTNQFVRKGFLHSSGKVVNKIGDNNG